MAARKSLIVDGSNVIPFPGHHRDGLSDLELIRGALQMLAQKLAETDDFDSHTERHTLSSLKVILAWLEDREARRSEAD